MGQFTRSFIVPLQEPGNIIFSTNLVWYKLVYKQSCTWHVLIDPHTRSLVQKQYECCLTEIVYKSGAIHSFLYCTPRFAYKSQPEKIFLTTFVWYNLYGANLLISCTTWLAYERSCTMIVKYLHLLHWSGLGYLRDHLRQWVKDRDHSYQMWGFRDP